MEWKQLANTGIDLGSRENEPKLTLTRKKMIKTVPQMGLT